MYLKRLLLSGLLALTFTLAQASDSGRHLFICSGQSNMQNLDLELSFIPTLEAALNTENENNVHVAKFAKGGQPIIKWILPENDETGSLLDEDKGKEGEFWGPLTDQINYAMAGHEFSSVTFVWMQGEKDSRDQGRVNLYKGRFRVLLKQLKDQYHFDSINVVIGRINDCTRVNKWNQMRAIQVELAEELMPNARWVNTDDLNTGLQQLGKKPEEYVVDNIHLTIDGYRIFGERLAEAALEILGSKLAMDENGWIESGPLLGWIYPARNWWVWSATLKSYIYLPKKEVWDSGLWLYLPD